MIGNLLSKAVKFTESGEITVCTKKIHDQLVISVSDTNVGMPQETLDTVSLPAQASKAVNNPRGL